jgi:hypothetical protein
MKKLDLMLKEYVSRISSEDLKYLSVRYMQMLFGDRAEIVEKLALDKEVDRWLSCATSADEFFDMVDYAGGHVLRENKRRSMMAHEDFKEEKDAEV